MISRRAFLVAGIASAAAMTLIGKAAGKKVRTGSSPEKRKPATALVLWYSQTGNTGRVGRAIAAAWKKAGLKVTYGDYRDIEKDSLVKYDIIAAGTPVYYYEVPENFRKWLEGIPQIDGKPVAAFVTFGGEGGNQQNTISELTDLLAQKGGVPVGTAGFSCMSTYSITWSMGNTDRILKYRDRPGAEAFRAASAFALESLAMASEGGSVEVSGNFSLKNIIKGSPSIGGSKLLITGHKVNREKCTGCGRCVKACPVDAINPGEGTVDTGRCIACLGCINNCPSGAAEMKFMGREVYGYREFIRRNNITISEPAA